jgi:hypothetical protein
MMGVSDFEDLTAGQGGLLAAWPLLLGQQPVLPVWPGQGLISSLCFD